MGERLGYRPALDGVRAVAITLVIGYHIQHWPADGYLGVELFFVLSGFLITSLLLEEHRRTGTIRVRNFYGRRVRRLYPALLVLVLVTLIANEARYPGRLPVLEAFVALSYATNLLYMAGGGIGVNEHLWTLAAEEQFYLVWPLILVLAFRRGIDHALAAKVIAVIIVVIAAWQAYLASGGASGDRMGYSPDTRNVAPMLLGALAAFLYKLPGQRLDAVAAKAWAPALVIAAGIIAAQPAEMFGGWSTLFAVCAAVVLYAALAPGRLSALLALTPLVWLGRISYSLYLWHFPLLIWAGHSMPRRLGAVALAFVLAALSYRFIEQPFRHAKHAPSTTTAPASEQADASYASAVPTVG